MTFKIPDITWDVGHSLNLYVGLQGPGWLYVLGIPPRGDLPFWIPLARVSDLGQGPNLRAVSGWAPCVPRSREHEKRPAAGRETKCRYTKKTHLYMCMYAYIWWRFFFHFCSCSVIYNTPPPESWYIAAPGTRYENMKAYSYCMYVPFVPGTWEHIHIYLLHIFRVKLKNILK